MSFSNLRKRTNINDLVQKAESLNAKKSYTDERIWKPTRDKSGNAFALIRFLPAPEPAVTPWVQYWDYGFKGPGGWYIEKSRKSLGLDFADPVADRYFELMGRETEEDKEKAKLLSRRLHFVSNVYIIDDKNNPENNGKVMLYDYGKTIYDKLLDSMKSEYEGDEEINPFDMWEGADFKVVVRTEGPWPKYDKSGFNNTSEFLTSDEEREEVYNKLYDITEFIDEKSYKSYEDLKKHMNKVLKLSDVKVSIKEVEEVIDPSPLDQTPVEAQQNQSVNTEEDEDMTSYFANLASED